MINARPNLNGNTSADFYQTAMNLELALDVVDKALADARGNVFHGRNYQTIPEWQQRSARSGDDLQMEYAYEAVKNLRYLATQIKDRGEFPNAESGVEAEVAG